MEPLRVTFVLDSADLRSVAILTEALTALDELALARNPGTAPLYESGAVYRTEPIGTEEFLTTPMIYQRGYTDCAGLGAARAAELRRQGHRRATAFPIETPDRPCRWDRVCPREIHVVVTRDGTLATLEDPSAVLGMRPVPPEVLRHLAHASQVTLGRLGAR